MGWVTEVKRKNGTKWRAGYYRPDGSIQSKIFSFRREGKEWVTAMEAQRNDGTWKDGRRAGETLGNFFEHALEARNLKPISYADHERTAAKWILPYIGGYELRRLDRRAVRDWLALIEKQGCKPRTRQKALAILSGTFRIAVEEDALESNPCHGVKVPQPDKPEIVPLAEEDVWKLAEAISPRYRALVLLLGYGGLRIGEAAALRVRDVDTLRGLVTVGRNVVEVNGELVVQSTTKGGRARVVPLAPTIRDELVSHINRYADTDSESVVFAGERGAYLRATLFLPRTLRPAAELLGLGSIRTHDLRHTAVAIAIGNGWDPLAISRMLGHADPGFTMRVYGHLLTGYHEDLVAQTETGLLKARAKAQASDGLRRLPPQDSTYRVPRVG